MHSSLQPLPTIPQTTTANANIEGIKYTFTSDEYFTPYVFSPVVPKDKLEAAAKTKKAPKKVKTIQDIDFTIEDLLIPSSLPDSAPKEPLAPTKRVTSRDLPFRK